MVRKMKSEEYVKNAISAYFIIHGTIYTLGFFFINVFGIWPSFLNFLLGNVTVSDNFFISILLGVVYVTVGIGLLFTQHWARIGLLILCVQAIFLEFPIGTLISVSVLVYSFSSSFSRLFPRIKKKASYQFGGIGIIAACIVALIVISGVTTGIVRFTAFQVSGIETTSVSAESKISSISQRVGLMDVLIELTGSPDYAFEQQDALLAEIAPYINRVESRMTEASNSLVVNIEASHLLKIAENENIAKIYPIEASFKFLPAEADISETPTMNLAPLQLNVEDLKKNGLTGKGITIAVMDTGIKEDHPDLQRDGKSIVVGSLHLHGEYVYPHGTMVASCIANQNKTWQGIAPDVNLLNIEVFSWQIIGGVKYLTATNADILKGFEFVANWKKLTGDYVILSCSWGVSSKTWLHDADVTIAAANRLATQYNIPIIAAAGNSGPGSRSEYMAVPYQVMSPAGGKNVLSVGAVDSLNAIASFSSRGPYSDGLNKPDVVAPGVNVPVLDYTGITVASGTSFACPYVSGVAALLAQNHKDLSSAQLYDAIRIGATDLGTKGYDYEYGYGIVDAAESNSYIDQTVTSQSVVWILFAMIVIGIIIIAYPAINKRLHK